MTKTKSIILTIIGTMLAGVGVGVFFTPNKIIGGGVSGISTILYHSLGIQPGVSFIVFNGILLLLGLKVIGKSFIIKTIIGASLLSVFVQIFSYFPFYTQDNMLATIFGGILSGGGIGLSFAAEASSGGTDILGRMIQYKFKFIPIGKLLLAVDGIIVASSYFIFENAELILYGVIAIFISSYMVDFVIDRLNVSRIAFVITENGEKIAEKLVSTSSRGVTLIDVKGMYTNKSKKMLFCALKESETEEFQRKILEIDNNAFIVFSESQRIKGKGFYLYK